MKKQFVVTCERDEGDRWVDEVKKEGEEKVSAMLFRQNVVYLLDNQKLGNGMVKMLIERTGCEGQSFHLRPIPHMDEAQFDCLRDRVDRLLNPLTGYDRRRSLARMCQDWRDRRGRDAADSVLCDGPQGRVLRSLWSIGAVPGGKWCSRTTLENDVNKKTAKVACYKDALDQLRDADLIETRTRGQAGGCRLTKYGLLAAKTLSATAHRTPTAKHS